MPPIRLTSFGYLHLPTGPDGQPIPPAADRIEDVRDRLRDPAAARDILDLDGLNPRVQNVVLNTPGARELLANLAAYAGLAPATRNSGSIRGEQPSKRGNKQLKRAFFLSAFAALGDPASRAYYDKKISQGKHHTQALLCLARRRADVLIAMLRDRTFYEARPAAAA